MRENEIIIVSGKLYVDLFWHSQIILNSINFSFDIAEIPKLMVQSLVIDELISAKNNSELMLKCRYVP